jgi:hypothetical protein
VTLWLLLWTLAAGKPHLGTVITSRQADGSWKCSAVCLTSGNDDAGYCRTPIVAKGNTEDACKAELARQCAGTQPPPGGCRWGSQLRPQNR